MDIDHDMAEAMGLVCCLEWQDAVLGLYHSKGQASILVALKGPRRTAEEQKAVWHAVGAGRAGVRTLRKLLRTPLGMKPALTYAVASVFVPHILCLAPTREDLPALLASPSACVRSSTQLHMGGIA